MIAIVGGLEPTVVWPLVVLILGFLCMPSLRRAVDRARSIRVKPGSVEIYLDPQGLNEIHVSDKESLAPK